MSYPAVDLLQIILRQYQLDEYGIHGVSHWARVVENGRRLAEITGADPEVVELFAIFHDSCRKNDGWDRGHGLRGAEFASSLRGGLFFLDDIQFDQLYFACSHHTDGLTEADITVQVCWDADRLDLGRVWLMKPQCDRLCTSAACQEEVLSWALKRSKNHTLPGLLVDEWGLELPG